MTLHDLVDCLPRAAVVGTVDVELLKLVDDSRAVEAGSVFVAVRGDAVDGHDYISRALEGGAAVVVAENPVPSDLPAGVAWIVVPDTRAALGFLADRWYDCPSTDLRVVGVTGTNGKTTTSFLLHEIMKQTLYTAGLIGTVRFDDGVEQSVATHTTPGTLALQRLLGTMRDNGCQSVAMEVSSHGLEQGRVAGTRFNVGIFTNLTQDHLDYHGTMEKYFASKKLLFAGMVTQDGKKTPAAVVNIDDAYGDELAKEFAEKLKVITYGFGAHCDFRAGQVKQSRQGLEFQLFARGKSYLVRLPLIGRFNVYNALSALAAASAVRIPLREAVSALADCSQVPGRMEYAGTVDGILIYVDYAHTPDALEHACRTLKEMQPNRLITVFGCGGDRDREKRPKMGRAAAAGSDYCVVTSDNPRSEEPASIVRHIERGMTGTKYEVEVDRALAIRKAVEMADDGDIVLIAGKGHESYQELADGKVDFDDRKEARHAMAYRRKKEGGQPE
jgi:UDP-N-acetylmuramoyl-L-alanyl-D-glutamate--2,6-diaminopimelate ligase